MPQKETMEKALAAAQRQEKYRKERAWRETLDEAFFLAGAMPRRKRAARGTPKASPDFLMVMAHSMNHPRKK